MTELAADYRNVVFLGNMTEVLPEKKENRMFF